MADYGQKRNAEGYSDPTAYKGTQAIMQAESEQQKRVNTTISIIKHIVDADGFDLIHRIELRDRRTGKEYR